MPRRTTTRLEWEGGHLSVGGDGAARLGDGPSLSLRLPTVRALDSGFAPVVWGAPEMEVSEGEIELRWETPGLRTGVRHHVSGEQWTVRATLSGRAGATTDGAACFVDPGSGSAWVWPSGSAAWVVLCDDPERPVGLRVRRGGLVRADHRAGAYGWVPGGGALPSTLELSGIRYASWADLAADLPAWLPNLDLPEGDDLVLPLPDDAVTGPGVTTDEGTVHVTGSGRVPLTVDGVTGRVRLEAHFAPALTRLLDAAADRIEAETVQGRPILASGDAAGAALVVLTAARRTQTEAYDLLEAHLAEADDGGAIAAVAQLVCLAGDVADHPVSRALRRVPVADTPVVLAAVAALGADIPGLLARVDLPVHGRPDVDPAAVVARLGAGLPGEPVPYDPAAMAQDVALLALTQPRLDPARWPMPAAVVAEHVARRLRATYDGDVRVLAWLIIAEAFG